MLLSMHLAIFVGVLGFCEDYPKKYIFMVLFYKNSLLSLQKGDFLSLSAILSLSNPWAATIEPYMLSTPTFIPYFEKSKLESLIFRHSPSSL